MKKFEKFLFFYGIVAVTVIFFGNAIFSPNPLNLISGAAILPILVYFWLRMTSAKDVEASKWSVRFIIIIAILSFLGLFGYFLADKSLNLKEQEEEVQENQTISKLEELRSEIELLREREVSDEELVEELLKIKEELARIRLQNTSLAGSDESLSQILSDIDDYQTGEITVDNPYLDSVDILETPSFSAKRIGEMLYGTNYSYSQYKDEWYEVELSVGITGWVHSRDVKEIN